MTDLFKGLESRWDSLKQTIYEQLIWRSDQHQKEKNFKKHEDALCYGRNIQRLLWYQGLKRSFLPQQEFAQLGRRRGGALSSSKKESWKVRRIYNHSKRRKVVRHDWRTCKEFKNNNGNSPFTAHELERTLQVSTLTFMNHTSKVHLFPKELQINNTQKLGEQEIFLDAMLTEEKGIDNFKSAFWRM